MLFQQWLLLRMPVFQQEESLWDCREGEKWSLATHLQSQRHWDKVTFFPRYLGCFWGCVLGLWCSLTAAAGDVLCPDFSPAPGTFTPVWEALAVLPPSLRESAAEQSYDNEWVSNCFQSGPVATCYHRGTEERQGLIVALWGILCHGYSQDCSRVGAA